MKPLSVTLIPATVIAQLSPTSISLLLWPGRFEHFDYNRRPTGATTTLKIDEVPATLRAPNTQVWLVTKSHEDGPGKIRFDTEVLPRHGDSYPEQYQHLEKARDTCGH